MVSWLLFPHVVNTAWLHDMWLCLYMASCRYCNIMAVYAVTLAYRCMLTMQHGYMTYGPDNMWNMCNAMFHIDVVVTRCRGCNLHMWCVTMLTCAKALHPTWFVICLCTAKCGLKIALVFVYRSYSSKKHATTETFDVIWGNCTPDRF